MSRQIIAYVFLLAFALQTFSRAIIVFDYKINTETYARNCENKARPKLHCNGKCQMMKKLKSEEQKDQQNPERKAENKNEILYFCQLFSSEIAFSPTTKKQLYASLQCKKEQKQPHAVFHPPAVA